MYHFMETILRRLTGAIVLWAIALGGSGCGANDGSVRSRETDGGAYRVSYHLTRDGFPLNEHCSLLVNVESLADEALPEALTIEVDADMPSHGHGINTLPEVVKSSPGAFEVEGLLFHMPGEWELYVDVVVGPVRERATFAFTL